MGRLGPLGEAQLAIEALELARVSPAAWPALHEAASAPSVDLDIELDHISVEALGAVASGLRSLHAGPPCDELWEWLAQPADPEAPAGGLARNRALLALLAQAIGGSGRIGAAAGGVYLALLSAEGAERSWGTLFQPAIFRGVLCALRPLRAQGRRPKPPPEGGGPGEGQEPELTQGEPVGGEPAAARSEASELLGSLVLFLQARPISASPDAVALTVAELAALVVQPVEESVAQVAAAGLSAVAVGAQGREEARRTATAVLRAVVPALLMAPDRTVTSQPSVPKVLQQARLAALGLVREVFRQQPALLYRRADPQPPDAAAEAVDSSSESEVEEPRGGGTTDEAPEAEAGRSDRSSAEEALPPELPQRGRPRKRGRGQGADDPILALLQILCAQAPERAEWRAAASDAVVSLLGDAAAEQRRAGVEADVSCLEAAPCEETELPASVLVRFLLSLGRLLRAERASLRVVAVEVAGTALERSDVLAEAGWGRAGAGEDAAAARARLDAWLLAALVRHCGDAVPTVRSHALNGLAAAIAPLSKYAKGRKLLQAALSGRGLDDPGGVDIPRLFRSAALDEKAFTRRASLGVFEAVLRLPVGLLDADLEALMARFDLDLLGQLACDDSVMVRRASVLSLSLLMRTWPTRRACTLWATSVLPLVLDPEGGVVERALEEVDAAVLQPLVRLRGEQRTAPPGDALAVPAKPQLPPVLEVLDSEGLEYLQRAVRGFNHRAQRMLLVQFASSLTSVVRECLELPLAEWPNAVWSLLEELASMGSKNVPAELILDAWERFDAVAGPSANPLAGCGRSPHAGAGGGGRGARKPHLLGVQILRVLEYVAPSLRAWRASELADGLRRRLSSLALPTEQVRAAMCVVERLERARLVDSSAMAAWRDTLLHTIEARLSEHVRQGGRPGLDSRPQTELYGCLVTLGELALVDEASVSASLVLALQTFVASAASVGEARSEMDSVGRGHALAALGKLCLRREALAKRSVELFVLHLGEHEPFAIRNNALIVLWDLCVHYTALVDRFVPCMADLLRDPNELLRKQAAMVLASLLSENFIKFKGPLMHRFLYALSDPAFAVRYLVECLFVRIIHKRNPTIFTQSFVSVVCVLNGWSGHPSYPGAADNESFCLREHSPRRTAVYRFMLSLMTQAQKFSVCAQLVTGFLAAFADAEGQQRLELPRLESEPGGQALSDAFSLLCCKEMRVCFSPKLAGQEDEDSPEADGSASGAGASAGSGAASAATGGASGAEAARGAFSGLLRRVVCESIVPVLVQLKDLMEAQRSPFLGRLRHCLCEILREFRDDLPEFLGSDARLVEEVAFDLAGATGAGASAEQGDEKTEGGAGTEGKALWEAAFEAGYGRPGFKKRLSIGTVMAASAAAAPPPVPAAPVPASFSPPAPPPAASPPASERASSEVAGTTSEAPSVPSPAVPSPSVAAKAAAAAAAFVARQGLRPRAGCGGGNTPVLPMQPASARAAPPRRLGGAEDLLAQAPSPARASPGVVETPRLTRFPGTGPAAATPRSSPGVGLVSAVLGLRSGEQPSPWAGSQKPSPRPPPSSTKRETLFTPTGGRRPASTPTAGGGGVGLVQAMEMCSTPRRSPPPGGAPAVAVTPTGGALGLAGAAELQRSSAKRRAV
uniref:Condensin complex subunit 1 C-terminal domain-containing protein n=1 Tax=Alexandrium monilatum TaxID=311494 RepID=A0A7S4VDN2_9DINO